MRQINSTRLAPALAALAVGMMLVHTASAQAVPVGLNSCRPDVRKWCDSIRPGGGRLAACLQQHQADLTPDCSARLPILLNCAQELHRLCGAGNPRELRDCAEAKRSQFSAQCQALAVQR